VHRDDAEVARESRTHPDEHVVDEVAGVADLAADGRQLEDRVLDVEALDGGLGVLERLADAHDCAQAITRSGRRQRACTKDEPREGRKGDARLRDRPRVLLRALRRATVSFE